MDLERIQEFLLWSLLINMGIYAITLVGVLSLRGFMSKIHGKLFGVSEETATRTMYLYLALYKLLLIVFCFVPWVAVQLVK